MDRDGVMAVCEALKVNISLKSLSLIGMLFYFLTVSTILIFNILQFMLTLYKDYDVKGPEVIEVLAVNSFEKLHLRCMLNNSIYIINKL